MRQPYNINLKQWSLTGGDSAHSMVGVWYDQCEFAEEHVERLE